MTDEQIIKAFEICSIENDTCGECCYSEINYCYNTLRLDMLDLIKRQQAEIERLEKWNKIKIEEMRQERQEYFENTKKYRAGIEEKYEKMFFEAEAQIRPTAIKKFVEKLKEKAKENPFWYIHVEDIDNLVKEMGCGNGKS